MSKLLVISSQFMVHSFIALLLLLLLSTTNYQLPTVYAQFDVANVFDIPDPDVKPGDILIFDQQKGLQRAKLSYDSHIFGIFHEQPAVVFRREGGKPVIRSGITKVNVSLMNGQIKKGDPITSSTLPGLGMKADLAGYGVGIALEDSKENQKFNDSCKINPDSCPKDQINIAVDISFKDLASLPTISFVDRLLNTVLKSLLRFPEGQGFGQFIKHLLAALIILLSLLFAYLIIYKVIPKAIEAIGRNPLAKRSIEFALVLSIGIVVAIVIGSIIAAILVIRL